MHTIPDNSMMELEGSRLALYRLLNLFGECNLIKDVGVPSLAREHLSKEAFLLPTAGLAVVVAIANA